MKIRIRVILALVLCLLTAFGSTAALASYFPTFEEGYRNIESKYGPFIGALARAIDGDYEVLESEYNWEYWFANWGLNVANVKERETALLFGGYDSQAVAQAVYASLAESSNAEIRQKVGASTADLGDESIPTSVLIALLGVCVAGAVVSGRKIKAKRAARAK